MPTTSTTDYLFNTEMAFLLNATTSLITTAELHIGLFTTMPGVDGTGGVEVDIFTCPSYVRVPIPRGSPSPTDVIWVANGLTGINAGWVNQGEILFNVPSENWGTIVGVGIFDDSNILGFEDPDTGNLLLSGQLGVPVTVVALTAPRIPDGALVIKRSSC